jgi:hypothetical protein
MLTIFSKCPCRARRTKPHLRCTNDSNRRKRDIKHNGLGGRAPPARRDDKGTLAVCGRNAFPLNGGEIGRAGGFRIRSSVLRMEPCGNCDGLRDFHGAHFDQLQRASRNPLRLWQVGWHVIPPHKTTETAWTTAGCGETSATRMPMGGPRKTASRTMETRNGSHESCRSAIARITTPANVRKIPGGNWMRVLGPSQFC